jgi:DNA-binding response OmpR family regulator
MRILIVEDNQRLNKSLRQSLTEDGYAVDSAFSGPEGEELAEMTPFDAIILDVMLPGKDGMAVCRDLRKHKIKTPILMLTARDTVEDRVEGLDSGADDYLVKPFALIELRARLRALLRRDAADKSGVLTISNLTLDPATR